MITTLQPTWREWILTNLRRNCSQESIVAAMAAEDFDPVFAKSVVAVLAAESASRGAANNTAPAKSARSDRPRLTNELVRERQESRFANSNVLHAGDRAVEVLARMTMPEILVLANVLTAAECEELMRRAREKLVHSTTVDPATGGAKVIKDRGSFGTYFNLNADDFIAGIDGRLSQLLRWPVERSEGIQILRYLVGGEYRPHFDYFPPRDPGSDKHLSQGGQRVGTLIMYLNDVDDGGETIFPEIGFSVVPRRGHAVYFGYCDFRGEVDPLTLHGGAPVRAGEKWIATKWLRQHPRA